MVFGLAFCTACLGLVVKGAAKPITPSKKEEGCTKYDVTAAPCF
jgi:quinol monooxygenase YgiN